MYFADYRFVLPPDAKCCVTMNITLFLGKKERKIYTKFVILKVRMILKNMNSLNDVSITHIHIIVTLR